MWKFTRGHNWSLNHTSCWICEVPPQRLPRVRSVVVYSSWQMYICTMLNHQVVASFSWTSQEVSPYTRKIHEITSKPHRISWDSSFNQHCITLTIPINPTNSSWITFKSTFKKNQWNHQKRSSNRSPNWSPTIPDPSPNCASARGGWPGLKISEEWDDSQGSLAAERNTQYYYH